MAAANDAGSACVTAPELAPAIAWSLGIPDIRADIDTVPAGPGVAGPAVEHPAVSRHMPANAPKASRRMKISASGWTPRSTLPL
jgi:hypothetical protein